MKILLLNPVTDNGLRLLRVERCQVKTVSLWPPLSLAYSASVLRENGFNDVYILDAEAENIGYEELISKIIWEKPDILTLQDTTPTINSDVNLAKRIKASLPRCITVFIGLHSTVRPQDVLGEGVDFTIRHEPEYILTELANNLKNQHDIKNVRGISYIRDGKLVNNPIMDRPKDIGEIPFPARDLIKSELYINPVTGKPFTILKTSRGCPYKCTYCTAVPYNGKMWRTRSVESVMKEIRSVVENQEINDFLFHSDTFNLDKNFVLRLCQQIKESALDITWMSNCRVDCFDEEVAYAMKDAGSQIVAFGTESGSEKMLERMKKGATLDQARKAIRACHKVGLRAITYFVLGLPGETKETMDETIRFAIELDAHVAQFFIATPFPGTEFYQEAHDNGWLMTDDWSRYLHGASDVVSYPWLTAEDIKKKQREAYRRFYFRPRKIISYLLKVNDLSELKQSIKGFIRFYNGRIRNRS